MVSKPILTKEEWEVIENIKSVIDKDTVLVFSNEEINVIKNMISVYQSIIAFGKLGTLFKNIIVGIATFIGAYLVIHNWGINALKQLLGIG